MKRVLSILFVLSLAIGHAFAQWPSEGRDYLVHETFFLVSGDSEEYAGATPIDDYIGSFDNPDGWTFTGGVYAGKGCIYLATGATITLPASPRLYDNAQFDFAMGPWLPNETWKPDEDFNESIYSLPCPLSISHGELSVYEFDSGSAMAPNLYIFGGTPESRITLTASHPIVISEIGVWYGDNPNATATFTYSHPEGDYYAPIDVTFQGSYEGGWGVTYDNSHDIIVYTTDGSTPTKQSTRYNREVLRIAETTTIYPAVIASNGQLCLGNKRTFNFPESNKPAKPENTFEVTVSQPGKLKSQLINIDADIIEGLVLKGEINGDDITYLTSGEGRAAAITYLDLSEVTVALDGSLYHYAVVGPPGGMGTWYHLYYYLSETNYEERHSTSPTTERCDFYRNNLACAFEDCTNFTTVILPKSMTTIGESIFSGCENLKYAPIHEGVTEVMAGAYSGTAVKMLDGLPSSIRKIGAGAFNSTSNNPESGYITFGVLNIDHPVEIGGGAFAGAVVQQLNLPFPGDSIQAATFACRDLREVNIGDGVKYIGEGAFCSNSYDNQVLEKAVIPESVTEIGYKAFDFDSPFIKQIEPEGGIRYIGKVAYCVADEKLGEYTIKEGTVSLTDNLFAYTNISAVNLPASLEIIGSNAFNSAAITSLPDMPGLKRIGAGAFSGTKIAVLPSMPSLEVIGEEAFYATQITSLPELPGLKEIYHWAFAYCPKLARVTLPESLERLEDAFYGCDALWSVTYNAIDCYCPYRVSPRDLERIVIGEKVRRLPKGLYTGNTNITEVTLPKSVEILDPEVFQYCTNLEYVGLADNITTISDNAFYGCSSLTGLHWPLNITTIGSAAFRECSALKVVSLPEGVTTVGADAFFLCSGVETLYIASTIEEAGYGAFTFWNQEKNITITTTAAQPIGYEWNWHYVGTPTIKVPAASIEAYRANAIWNGSNNGKQNVIITIEDIEAPEEESTTSFSGAGDGSDLSDTVIGDVYVTIGEEDGYDDGDGSIVLNSTMSDDDADAIGGMAPGKTDLQNRFNGLVVMVAAGDGTVSIDCRTIGSRRVAVKIGDGEPQLFTKDEKGVVSVEYNVTADTYIYIYGVDTTASAPAHTKAGIRAAATGDCVKFYSITVNPKTSGVEGIEDEAVESPITDYYTIDGVRIAAPDSKGIYVVRRADGTTGKVIVK
ncbi:MAG: leucine-rich repeat protein [Muribaculaceae bacterium]